MTELVDPDRIEDKVGARRHPRWHLGRAVSDERTIYILHSGECRDSGVDLRDCVYSVALDRGIDRGGAWTGWEDVPVVLGVGADGGLGPVRLAPGQAMRPRPLPRDNVWEAAMIDLAADEGVLTAVRRAAADGMEEACGALTRHVRDGGGCYCGKASGQ